MEQAASSAGSAETAVAWEDGVLIVERSFAAPRPALFRAWTEAEAFARWFGPAGARLPFCTLDARPGGKLHFCHRFPDHADVWVAGIYEDVVPDERIAFTCHFSDADGNVRERPGFPAEMRIAVAFTDEDGGTNVRIRQSGLVRDQGEVQGWMESMDRLQALQSAREPGNDANDAGAEDREIVLERTFDAPRALVFRAFTDPEHLREWWGPRGFTTTMLECDPRPGGVWRFVLHGPDGVDYPNWIAYEEVAAPERIAYAHGGEREKPEFHVTIRFEEADGRTRVTMRMLLPTSEARAHVVGFGAIELGHQTLDKLAERLPLIAAEALPAGGELVITRVVAARRERVFRAWTEREHLMRWWGPAGSEVIACTNDLHPGGRMLFCLRGPGGVETWARWTYQEVSPPERLAFVLSFSDAEGNTVRAPFSDSWPLEVLTAVTFDEQQGRTIITVRGVPVNASDAEQRAFREMHGSMREGWGGTLDKLEAHVAGSARG